MKEVYILHAYSSNNSGDGLLVEKTIENVNDFFSNEIKKIVVAIDPHSFYYLPKKYKNIEVVSIPKFIMKALFFKLKDACFVAVGGGYLRSGNFVEGLKCVIAHGSQILVLSKYKNLKKVYLPQSIGPLNGLLGRAIAKLLKTNIDLIFARDDKTATELASFNIKNVERAPDLVSAEILKKVGSKSLKIKKPLKVYLVARDLSSRDYNHNYLKKLKELYNELGNVEVVIQSSSRGNDDISFAKDVLGVENCRSLKDALSEKPGIVVSVRLHGSLESILSGNPSVHLAYERKGFAAYEDLGISGYCQHCSGIDVNAVVKQVSYLKNSYSEYQEQLYSIDSNLLLHNKLMEVLNK